MYVCMHNGEKRSEYCIVQGPKDHRMGTRSVVYEVHSFPMHGLDIVVHAKNSCNHVPIVSQTAHVGLLAICRRFAK